MLHAGLHDFSEAGGFEQVGLDQNHRLGALQVEFGLQRMRFALGRVVMQRQPGPRVVQPPRDRGADTLGSAGDEYGLVLQLRGCR